MRKLALLVMLCSGGLVMLAQTEAALAHKVVVGKHSLYLSCTGEGSPTVVMDVGYGDASEVWAEVQPQVAAFTRVCVYDRAGLGRSDVVGERTVQDAVADS